ncbi:MAG TPA: twin-arginine translocase subunit TatC, partial [Anaerolineales bacterium]|nr:twin-arginine translocase subunit TatC [Anaerolineales bacterium]
TGIAQLWTAKEYFGFITGLMLWIGLFFESPLVIFVLTYIGIIQPKTLARQWRLAVVIIAILAAAVTPTVDPANMGLVMLPMTLIYFFSILLSYLAAALRGKGAQEAENAEELGAGRPIG